jgi:hypothetical protein
LGITRDDAFPWKFRTRRDLEMEHSERARYVTDQVSLWIANDSDYVEQARSFIRTEGSVSALGDFLVRVIKSAPQFSAPWQVAQELSANDFGRIHWQDVADELRED